MGAILISAAVSLIAIVGFIYFTAKDKKQEKKLHGEQSEK